MSSSPEFRAASEASLALLRCDWVRETLDALRVELVVGLHRAGFRIVDDNTWDEEILLVDEDTLTFCKLLDDAQAGLELTAAVQLSVSKNPELFGGLDVKFKLLRPTFGHIPELAPERCLVSRQVLFVNAIPGAARLTDLSTALQNHVRQALQSASAQDRRRAVEDTTALLLEALAP